ncbi:hypothetical protein SGLAM104S_03555 [Streptomyces glaucescens]
MRVTDAEFPGEHIPEHRADPAHHCPPRGSRPRPGADRCSTWNTSPSAPCDPCVSCAQREKRTSSQRPVSTAAAAHTAPSRAAEPCGSAHRLLGGLAERGALRHRPPLADGDPRGCVRAALLDASPVHWRIEGRPKSSLSPWKPPAQRKEFMPRTVFHK